MLSRTILAADDSIGVLDALVSIFGPPSYRVVGASNGKEALTLARAVRPDLVITDVMLRVVTGIEFVRELRDDAELRRTPVVLWSAAYSPHQIDGFAKGCEPFTALNKFEDLDGFVSVVNELLTREDRAGSHTGRCAGVWGHHFSLARRHPPSSSTTRALVEGPSTKTSRRIGASSK